MRVSKKKAKLAHDKRQDSAKQAVGVGPYTFQSVIDMVEYHDAPWALVDVDGQNTLALVDPGFTRVDSNGNRVPGGLACPAAYCSEAGTRARTLAADYLASQEASATTATLR